MSYFISTLLIWPIVSIVIAVLRAKTSIKETKNPYMFKYPKSILVISVFGICFELLLAFWMLTGKNEYNKKNIYVVTFYLIFMFTAAAVFFAGMFWLLLTSLNRYLILDDEHIVYRNLFGVTRRFEYKDVTKIKVYYDRSKTQVEMYRVYIGKKRISIDYFSENFKVFPRRMKNRLRRAKNHIEF